VEPTGGAARSYDDIIEFRPSEAVQSRVAELVQLSKDGTISPEQQSELDDFLELEHLMILAKARARHLSSLAK